MAVAYEPQFQPKVRLEWISESWQLFLAQAGTWVATLLIWIVIDIILQAACKAALGIPLIERTHGAIPFYGDSWRYGWMSYYTPQEDAVSAISFAVNAFFAAGMLKMANAQVRGEQISPGMLFSGASVYLNMLGYLLVQTVAIFVGLALCIFPAFVAAGLFLPGQAMVADGVALGIAMNKSVATVKNDWFAAGLLTLLSGILVLVSALPCFLGLLATLPMLYLISSLAYRDMIGMPNGAASPLSQPYYASQPQAPGVWPPAPGSGYPPTAPEPSASVGGSVQADAPTWPSKGPAEESPGIISPLDSPQTEPGTEDRPGTE